MSRTDSPPTTSPTSGPFTLARIIPRDRGAFIALLLTPLILDALFIGVDLAVGASDDYPELLHVYTEGGIPEWFQYAKFVSAAALMFVLARRTDATYCVWAGVFFYMFADDAFMIHERIAGKTVQLLPLDELLDLPFDVWIVIEPAYMVGVGGAVLLALWFVGRRGSSRASRRYTREAIALLVLFAAFTAGGDVIGRLVFGGTHLPEVIEDGGEMVVATLLLAHAAFHVVRETANLSWVSPRGRPTTTGS